MSSLSSHHFSSHSSHSTSIGKNVMRLCFSFVILFTLLPFLTYINENNAREKENSEKLSIWWLKRIDIDVNKINWKLYEYDYDYYDDDLFLNIDKNKKYKNSNVKNALKMTKDNYNKNNNDNKNNINNENSQNNNNNYKNNGNNKHKQISKWGKKQREISAIYSSSLSKGAFCTSVLERYSSSIGSNIFSSSKGSIGSNIGVGGSMGINIDRKHGFTSVHDISSVKSIWNKHSNRHNSSSSSGSMEDIRVWDASLGVRGVGVVINILVTHHPTTSSTTSGGGRSSDSVIGSSNVIGIGISKDYKNKVSDNVNTNNMYTNNMYRNNINNINSINTNTKNYHPYNNKISCRIYNHRSQLLTTVNALPAINIGRYKCVHLSVCVGCICIYTHKH